MNKLHVFLALLLSWGGVQVATAQKAQLKKKEKADILMLAEEEKLRLFASQLGIRGLVGNQFQQGVGVCLQDGQQFRLKASPFMEAIGSQHEVGACRRGGLSHHGN